MAWLRGVFFLDGSRGWAVGSRGAVLRTEDGGHTWIARPRPTADNLRDVIFVSGRSGWLVCERNFYELRTKTDPRSYLLRTDDGGETWQRVEAVGQDIEVMLTRAVFADGQHGWVFGESGAIYATHDGGIAWSRQAAPTHHLLLGAHFLDRSRGWVVGAGGTVLSTKDGGENWQSQASALPAAARRARLGGVHFADERRGWIVGSGSLILATTDGGRTWQTQTSETDVDLFDVRFLHEREGWAVGAGGTVLHTTDGGARWQAESSVTRHPLERLALADSGEAGRAWAVGFGGTILANIADGQPSLPPRLRPNAPAVTTRKRRVNTPAAPPQTFRTRS